MLDMARKDFPASNFQFSNLPGACFLHTVLPAAFVEVLPDVSTKFSMVFTELDAGIIRASLINRLCQSPQCQANSGRRSAPHARVAHSSQDGERMQIARRNYPGEAATAPETGTDPWQT